MATKVKNSLQRWLDMARGRTCRFCGAPLDDRRAIGLCGRETCRLEADQSQAHGGM